MMKEIMKFMQAMDRNGEWDTALEETNDLSELQYEVFCTLTDWKEENGMQVTPRVQGYFDYLKAELGNPDL